MAKRSPAVKRSDGNLVVAIGATVLISAGCALFTAWIIDDILTAMSTSQSMALIIVDGGAKGYVSDDGKLGEQLTQATVTLRSCFDISVSLAVGTLLIGGGLIYRLTKKTLIRG